MLLCAFVIFFVKFCVAENWARGKPTQASPPHTAFSTADKAVDGNRNQDYDAGSCYHSVGYYSPTSAFWTVDLGRILHIHNITIFGRIGFQQRLTGSIVYASNTSDVGGDVCYVVTAVNDSVLLDIFCNRRARYVTIYQNVTAPGDSIPILELCEVEVHDCPPGWFGTDCSKRCHCRDGSCDSVTGLNCGNNCPRQFERMENWARGKPTQASPPYSSISTADKAVDGNRNQVFEHGSCYHSGTDNFAIFAFWTVDLEQILHIHTITIFGRSGQLKRLIGSIVYASNTSDAGGDVCYMVKTVPDSGLLDISCNRWARYVTIYQNVTSPNDRVPTLELCEVEVHACSPGWFGTDCSRRCRSQDESCDSVTGLNCGDNCPHQFKILENWARGKPTQSSSPYSATSTSDKAVDGNRIQVFHEQGSCFHSVVNTDVTSAFWTVDLEQILHIHRITIFGRSASLKRLIGSIVYASNTSDVGGDVCYMVNSVTDSGVFDIFCNRWARYITIYQNVTAPNDPVPILELCEVEVHGRECETGCASNYYGKTCSYFRACRHENMFGHCHYDCHCESKCDVVTGVCPNEKCVYPWSGPTCQKENVAAKKPVLIIPKKQGLDGQKLVDGDQMNDCSDYAGHRLILNLQAKRDIQRIRLFGKIEGDMSETLSLPEISLKTESTDSWMICSNHTVTQSEDSTTAVIDVPCQQRAQFIQFRIASGTVKKIFKICEIEVLRCFPGTFGEDCDQLCHCQEGTCSASSGLGCVNGCTPGYSGDTCSVPE